MSFNDYESKIKPPSCFDEPISNKIAFSFGSPPRKKEKYEAKLPTPPKTNHLSSEQLADIPLPAGPVPMAIDSSAAASSATIFSPAISNVCANNKLAGEKLATSMAPVFVVLNNFIILIVYAIKMLNDSLDTCIMGVKGAYRRIKYGAGNFLVPLDTDVLNAKIGTYRLYDTKNYGSPIVIAKCKKIVEYYGSHNRNICFVKLIFFISKIKITVQQP